MIEKIDFYQMHSEIECEFDKKTSTMKTISEKVNEIIDSVNNFKPQPKGYCHICVKCGCLMDALPTEGIHCPACGALNIPASIPLNHEIEKEKLAETFKPDPDKVKYVLPDYVTQLLQDIYDAMENKGRAGIDKFHDHKIFERVSYVLKVNNHGVFNNTVTNEIPTPKVERTNWKCNKCECKCSISTNSKKPPILCVYSEKYVNWTRD